MEATSCQDISLTSCTSIISSVRDIVAAFYGPQCSQTLLTSQTGKAVVTSDGYTILETLQADHPVSQCIFQAIKRCHGYTLDGCKFFLALLDNISNEISKAVKVGKFSHSGTNLCQNRPALERQGVLCVRRALQCLIGDVLTEIYTSMLKDIESGVICGQETSSVVEILKNVSKTTLMPHFNPKVCEFLASKLSETLKYDESFLVTLDMLSSKFYSFIIRVPSRPYSQCSLIDPFLMRCKFLAKCESLSNKAVNVVILRQGVDNLKTGEESREKLSIKSAGQVTALLLHKRKTIEAFAEVCSRKKVDVLICTENVPSFAVEILQRRNISVVAFALTDEVDILELLSGKVSLNTVHDEITDNNVIPLNGIVELAVGGLKYLQFQMALPWKHLVLCAPTVGLCDQLAIMCQKALKSCMLCFESDRLLDVANLNFTDKAFTSEIDLEEGKDDNDGAGRKVESKAIVDNGDQRSKLKAVIVPGGGGFEFLLATKLENYASSCSDSDVAILSTIFHNSLIDILKLLHRNTSTTDISNRAFMEILNVMQEKYKIDGELWGIDRRGRAGNMVEKGVYEPVAGKYHVVQCVLELVGQLIRVDKVVSVRKVGMGDSDDD